MAPTTLSILFNQTHGTVPWTATITGTLSDSLGVGIPNAQIPFQYLAPDGVTWNFTGITATTDASGNYAVEFPFTEANGWVAGLTGVIRASFSGDGVNDASASDGVTVTMDGGGGGGATALTFSCNPLSGTVPWTTTVTGRLTNASGGVPNATIMIEFLGSDGITWYPAGVFIPPTDSLGNYTTSFEFTTANGWTPGTTGTLRASFAGDAVNLASQSAPVTVTMNAGGTTDGYLAVSATQNGIGVNASVTADGQTGTTPVTFTFTPTTPTTYTVTATFQGVSLTQTVTVTAGQTSTLVFNFGGGEGFNMLIPAAIALGVVSVVLVVIRKPSGKRKQKRKRR